MDIQESIVKRRTLTNLYNALALYRSKYKAQTKDLKQWKADRQDIITLDDIEELDYIHGALDNAVISAYGWQLAMDDEDVLSSLLELNLSRPHSDVSESTEEEEGESEEEETSKAT